MTGCDNVCETITKTFRESISVDTLRDLYEFSGLTLESDSGKEVAL
jgi:hypothetical protein